MALPPCLYYFPLHFVFNGHGSFIKSNIVRFECTDLCWRVFDIDIDSTMWLEFLKSKGEISMENGFEANQYGGPIQTTALPIDGMFLELYFIIT